MNLQINQNPHVAGMQDQLALVRKSTQAQKEGAEKVQGSFDDFAAEMRNNYASVIERNKLLEERLVTKESEMRLFQEAHQNTMQQCLSTIEQLLAKINTLEEKVNTLEKSHDEHTHELPYWCYTGTHNVQYYTTTYAPKK